MRIDEGKGGVARQRDPLAGRLQRIGPPPARRRRGRARAHRSVEIDMGGDEAWRARRAALRVLPCRRPARGRDGARAARFWCRAEGRRTREGRLPRSPSPSRRRWRSLPTLLRIDPGDFDGGIVGDKPLGDGRRRLRLAGHVEHQHDRQPELARERRRRSRCGRRGPARRRTGPSRLRRSAGRRLPRPSRRARRAARSAIAQVSRLMPGAPGGGGVKGAVDVVRARFRRPRRARLVAQARATGRASTVVLPLPERGAAISRPRGFIGPPRRGR